MRKPVLVIVGFGPMGKKFARLFSAGFDVRISSSRGVETEAAECGAACVSDRRAALASSDYIFLAVPIAALAGLIEEINDVSRDDVIVVDCCSARVPAEHEFCRLSRRHFGIHDLAKNEYVITGNIDPEMSAFFARQGTTIHTLSAEEHDKANAVIGLAHFIGLAVGQLLTAEDRAILSGMASGSKLMALVEHFPRKSSTTWRETQIDNPFTRVQRERLLEAFNHYHQALTTGHYPFSTAP